jgi:hypothetical protein
VTAGVFVDPGVAGAAAGRPLGGLAGFFPFFAMVEPGQVYGERLNQLDIRLAKIIKFSRARASLNFDIYNLFNVDTITNQVNQYTPSAGGAIWQTPTLILQARFLKVGFQIDF